MMCILAIMSEVNTINPFEITWCSIQKLEGMDKNGKMPIELKFEGRKEKFTRDDIYSAFLNNIANDKLFKIGKISKSDYFPK